MITEECHEIPCGQRVLAGQGKCWASVAVTSVGSASPANTTPTSTQKHQGMTQKEPDLGMGPGGHPGVRNPCGQPAAGSTQGWSEPSPRSLALDGWVLRVHTQIQRAKGWPSVQAQGPQRRASLQPQEIPAVDGLVPGKDPLLRWKDWRPRAGLAFGHLRAAGGTTHGHSSSWHLFKGPWDGTSPVPKATDPPPFSPEFGPITEVGVLRLCTSQPPTVLKEMQSPRPGHKSPGQCAVGPPT